MNSTIFYRLLWKEFRQVRAFAICLLAFGLALQLILLVTNSSLAGSQAASLIGLLFPALFVAGCAATIFSMEHENHSFLMQRMLPVSPRAVFAAKIAVCVSLAVALLLILSTLPQLSGARYVISGWLSPAAMVLLTFEFLAWGTLFSIVDRRPMRSLGLTVAVPLTIAGIIFFVDSFFHGPEEISYLVTPAIAVIRVAIILVVGACALLKSHEWFEERQSTGRVATFLESMLPNTRTQTIERVTISPRSDWSRLFWLQCKSTLWTMIGVAVVAVIGIGATLGAYWIEGDRIPEGRFFYSFAFLGISGAIIGGIAWLATGNRREFLAHAGVHPLKVAFSQLLGGALFLLPGIAIATLLSWNFEPSHRTYSPRALPGTSMMLSIIVFAVTGFGWAQLLASFSRSKMIAVIIGPIVGILATLWPLLCLYTNVPFWYGPAIFLVLPFVLTIVNSRDWLLGLPVSRIAITGLGAGIVASVALFGFYRATEFPPADEQRVEATLAMDESMSAESSVSAEKLQKVRSAIADLKAAQKQYNRWNAFKTELRPAEPERLALLERFIELQPIDVTAINNSSPASANSHDINRFLSQGLVNATHDNDLDLGERIILSLNAETIFNSWTMFPSYVWQWANHPDNTSDCLIRVAQHLLKEPDSASSIPSRRDTDLRSMWDFYSVEGKTPQEAYESVHSKRKKNKQHPALKIADRIFFWEGIRDKRIASRAIILDSQMRALTRRCLESDTDFAKAKDLLPESQTGLARAASTYGELTAAIVGLTGTGSLEDRLWRDYLSVSRARAEALRIAIIAWSKDHDGAMPEELSELVPAYLSHVPNDPVTARPFHWFPHGIDIEKAAKFVQQIDLQDVDVSDIRIEGMREAIEREKERAGRPFLLRAQHYELFLLDLETEELNFHQIASGWREEIVFTKKDSQ